MTLSYIPILAILLINLAVIAWVIKNQDRTRSGFFLIVNALSLIIWAGGQALYRNIGTELPWVLSLPYLAALIVPGNFLYYALTRPHPLTPGWRSPVGILVIFAPAVVLSAAENYSMGDVQRLFGYSYRVRDILFESITRRLTVLYLIVFLGAALVVLGVRYYTSAGPERNTCKHLIATILGPLMFAGIFWASTVEGDPAAIPSPSFLFAIMAQGGLVVVLRQEELGKPRTLGRAVYYLTAVLIAFVLINLLSEFYSFAAGSIMLERTAGWMMLGATLALLLVARLRFVEHTFERLLFTRATEYRQAMDETRQELREARERLHRAERLSMVGEVAARVAHEIKNPLGPIRGYAQMMREKLEKDPSLAHRDDFREYLDVITEEVENIDRRVKEFLSSARQPQLHIGSFPLNDMVERCARVIRLELTAGRDIGGEVLPIRVECETDPAITDIRADASRLEEAIFNLARNALEALGEQTRGRILFRTVAVQGPDGEPGAQISIADNGPGFPPDKMNRFFEPFFTQKEGGTGLGLAIVKSTVEAHGGTISLRNRELGGGEVSMWMPLVARENPGALLPKPITER